MTLSCICDENMEAIKYSLQQPNRLHMYDGLVITSIRKAPGYYFPGDYFQVQTADGWYSVVEGSNLVVYR